MRAGEEETFTASLMARAKKREVIANGGHDWCVVGDPKLGDSFSDYMVVRSESGRYSCSCYTNNYGDVRQRRTCSHVLAVMIHNAGTATPQVGLAASSPSLPIVPRPDDERFYDPAGPLPKWVETIYPHQWRAVEQVIDAYNAGAEVVILDAPTGSGKTLIAELTRRVMGTRGLYVCSDRGLQDQVLRDFPYARMLKGRANYPTQFRSPPFTAADCLGEGCVMCEECPYYKAKEQALSAQLAVLNTAYLMAEANSRRGSFTAQPFIIADECDMLERALMGFVEFRTSARFLRELGIDAPKKGSHKATIAAWLRTEFIIAAKRRRDKVGRSAETAQEYVRLSRAINNAKVVANEIGGDSDNWVRDNDAGPLVMRPVRVTGYGKPALWEHAKRWLLMSATVISGEQMAWSLGIENYRVVRVPMTFPAANRPIHVAPVANMSMKGKKDGSWQEMARVLRAVLERHAYERVLVHTVSYALAHSLIGSLSRGELGAPVIPRSRKLITYTSADGREPKLKEWLKSTNGILFAPSLDRGVDLKGDMCRAVVIAKVPFPNLGDVQVSALLHMGREGAAWYATETVRTIVQMTGRGVRSEDDTCATYILDSQFVTNTWRNNKPLFPEWWREAVDTGFNVRALLRDAGVITGDNKGRTE